MSRPSRLPSGASPRRRRPVPARWVLLGIVLAAVGVAGVATLGEALRPPFSGDDHIVSDGADVATDPREEVDCTLPRPREDRPRPPDRMMGPAGPVLEVPSAVLVDCPQTFDGLRVRLRGEVVGGVLERDDGAWIQLNDGAYAQPGGPLPFHRLYVGSNSGVGVFLPDEVADDVDVVGGPDTRGDIVTVVGTFHRVDDASAEVAIVRARTGRVVESGGPLHQPVLWDRAVVAAVLTVAAAALVGLERWVSRRRRR